MTTRCSARTILGIRCRRGGPYKHMGRSYCWAHFKQATERRLRVKTPMPLRVPEKK